jgi:threonine aldolase
VHPDVLSAIAAANVGHAFGYGHDAWTERLSERVRAVFGESVQAFPVWNGSGANILALRACCRPWEAAICAETGHLNVDESGAPEAVAGIKLLTVPVADGKVSVEGVRARIVRIGDEHAVQPRVLSISNSTELGTVYGVDEVRALADLAHSAGMVLHVDGARIANAAASAGVGLAQLTGSAGVDVLSFGGTKNGLLGAEAVVFFDPALADGFLWLRKQSLQLASKMRFLAVQLEALLTDDLWLGNASHANAMARRLADAVSGLPAVRITRPVQSNAVFCVLPAAAAQALQREFDFYVWDEATGEVRWMCAWDTTEDDVDRFAAAVAAAV